MTSQSFTIVPAALYQGDYHLGVAALVNSLHRAGFRGEFLIGYRGPLPHWAEGLRPLGAAGEHCLDIDGVALRFVPVPPGPNLSAAKPAFMLDMLDRLTPQADAVMMFDADIVAIGPWQFFAEWAGYGVGLCQDMSYPILPDGHPHRHRWRAMARALGRECRNLDWYFNGGFVSVRRADRIFLETWRDLLALVAKELGPLEKIKIAARSNPLAVPDQDMLNAAAMATQVPISPLGPDGMGFTPGGFAMLHAVAEKPWRARYLRRALGGRPPGAADKAFWEAADGPLKPFPPATLFSRLAALRYAAAIGRFYRRNG